jgi:hypothetical protein
MSFRILRESRSLPSTRQSSFNLPGTLVTGLSRFHAFQPEPGIPSPPFGISRFGLSEWAPPTALGIAAVLLRPSRPRILGLLLALPIVVSAMSGGGDHMRGMRLFVPAVLMTLAAAAYPCGDQVTGGRALRTAAIITALWNLLYSTARGAPNDQAAAVGAQVGRFLESRLSPGSLIATATAGSTPFFAPSLDFIDTLGLNDRVIAERPVAGLRTYWQAAPGHRKGNGEYVLERKPDLIVIGPAEGTRADAPIRQWFLTDFELSESHRFHVEYRGLLVQVPVDRSVSRALPLPRLVLQGGVVPCVFYVRRGSAAEKTLVPLAEDGRQAAPDRKLRG